MKKSTMQTIQKWGNSLAVRIPGAIARTAHFEVGQTVAVSLQGDAVVLKPTGLQKLTLAQKLGKFDPSIHGGESMATTAIGAEVI